MSLSSSTWLPWLFFGPLLAAMLSGVLYQLTGHAGFAVAAKIGLGLVLLVAAAAFIASRLRNAGPGNP